MRWTPADTDPDRLTPLRRALDPTTGKPRITFGLWYVNDRRFLLARSVHDRRSAWEIVGGNDTIEDFLVERQLNWSQTQFATRKEALAALGTALHAARTERSRADSVPA